MSGTHSPSNRIQSLGYGIGWRPELALPIDRYPRLGFVEVVAENISASQLPPAIDLLRSRGLSVIPHGISLSLGGAEPIDRSRVRHLASLAKRCGAPLVSEHIAFVRAGGLEAGHLLPVPRTRGAIDVLVHNVKRAQDDLSVPIALENISALLEWPGGEMHEAEFISEVLDRTGALLLLDVANVWANARNFGGDTKQILDDLPLERLAYVHVAGGEERAGIYHDTHAARVTQGVLNLLEELCARCEPPGVMLERDDQFPYEAQLHRELDEMADAVLRGRGRRVGIGPEAANAGR
jgi:hypothetical protein